MDARAARGAEGAAQGLMTSLLELGPELVDELFAPAAVRG